jgi:hypothetical protein
MPKSAKPTGTEAVDDYMRNLDHPMKAEIEALRSIILNANPKVQERVKWNAPSFYYKDDIAAFHPRAKGYVHIVFVFHRGKMIEDGLGVLEGDYKDRRMAKFHDMADIEARREALERIINQWVEMTDAESAG